MPEVLRYRFQVAAGGQNSRQTDETADLKAQGEKRGEVDDPERAQEQPARNQAVRGPMLPVKQPTERGPSCPVHDRGHYTRCFLGDSLGSPSRALPAEECSGSGILSGVDPQ